ncbi:MAG: hypothetical protein IPG25_13950 [Proteobacteria bacterium]|nr:hypothetical protein [Pseudomonadota bacterium]
MQRVALVLADLYLHSDGQPSRGVSPVELPALATLLRYATPQLRCSDWRHWLSQTLGVAAQAPSVVAANSVAGAVDGTVADVDRATTWVATPVHLQAQLSHVQLSEQGLLRLEADEQAELVCDFARFFGPQLSLSATSPRDFLLAGLAAKDVLTRDPARLLGNDIRGHLPQGGDATRLRSLASEFELWLHSHAVNEERRVRRLPTISTLWLWGNTAPRSTATPSKDRSTRETWVSDNTSLFGDDGYTCGIAASAGLRPVAAPPENWRSLEAAVALSAAAIVVLWPLSSAREGLTAFESQWFEPALAALQSGRITELVLLANDRTFSVRRRDLWKWWRSRQTWFARLSADQP